MPPFRHRHRHINLLGRYSFLLPAELAGGQRPLRDPDTIDDVDDKDDELVWAQAGAGQVRVPSVVGSHRV